MSRYKIISTLFLGLAALFVLISCSAEESLEPNRHSGSEAYMKIELNMPDYKIPTDRDEKKTKSMNDAAEKVIKTDRLNIFVFRSDDKFYYKAPISDLTIEAATGKVIATIKLVKPETSENFNIVVIANHDQGSLSLVENTTTKSDILEQLKYTVNTPDGKWNAKTGSSAPLPMWAEIQNVVVSGNMLPVELNLYRALARVDVGLAFKLENDGKLTEETLGLDNFQLKEVKIYRTYKDGHVAPLRADYTTVPSVPSGSERYADDKPLEYAMIAAGDSYLREIYLPEANLPSDPSGNNMHCVIIGGYYLGSSEVTYYRLDFAEINKDVPITYWPILRNHRYVFNILNVKSSGFSSPDQALKSTSSGSNVDYELIKWDESIHEMHVEGKYYFGVDNRGLVFKPKATAQDAGNVHTIKYQTNYPLSSADGITLEWESVKNGGEAIFEAKWIEGAQHIQITALKTNDTNVLLTDILNVKAGPFVIQVNIQQEFIRFNYIINCEDVEVFGTYTYGTDLNPNNHYIQLSITAEDVSINGMDYIIETEPMYGVVFKATGTFAITEGNKTIRNIRLRGEGTLITPEDLKAEPFTVRIISNSSLGAYCEATITPVISKMTILTLANNTMYGYDIGIPGTGSYKVITSPNNFGAKDNSIVKIEGFNFVRGTGWTPATLGSTALQWLRDGYEEDLGGGVRRKRLADILCIGYNDGVETNEANVRIILDYMKMGGVVVMFSERDYMARNLGKLLFPASASSITLSHFGQTTTIPFVGNNAYKGSKTDEAWNDYLQQLQPDPIMNGPFGDLRDKQWGEDASLAVAIGPASLFENDPNVTIYSYGQSLQQAQNNVVKTMVGAFKYETDKDASEPISLVYFGDGGFVSSQNGEMLPSLTICPLWWNSTTFFPVPKTNYGSGTRADAYNSQAFCNIMAWAVKRAADLQAKRDASIN